MEQMSIELIAALIAVAISVISMIIAFVAIVRYKTVYRQYDMFMRGRDAESLEDLILDEKERIDKLEAEGMGGKISFAMALLDYTNSGLIINCMHGANGCFLYVKDVEAGATDVQLGTEEKGALERALGYVKD